MKNGILKLGIGLFLCFACSAYAQNDTLKPQKYLHHYVSVSPLAIFSGIFRADYEYIFKDKQYALVVTGMSGSTIHTRASKNFTRTSNGLEVGGKLYSGNINTMEPEDGIFYLAAGLRYQYLTFEYEDDVWKSQKDDSTGLYLYRLSRAKIYPKAHRFSIVPQIGLVLRYNRFMCDFYLGASLYREMIKGNEKNADLPLNNWSNVGMNHMTIFAGVKLGVVF